MLFGRMMGIVPLGVGVTVLGFAWRSPLLPTFFRLFFSFVALGFVITGLQWLAGFGMNSERISHLAHQIHRRSRAGIDLPAMGGVNYACPNCGASLGSKSDVSPHGDVKCPHCNRWFNIHSGPVA